MKITFDPAKNITNLRKHKVSLADCEGVFYDPRALTREDTDHDELRFVTLGMTQAGELWVVAYTYRGEDIRVISARRAEPRERRQYEA
jgi:uncharacterized DUF497 family protein